MALKVWEGDVSTEFLTDLNWFGDVAPGPTDIAHFDGSSANACIVGEGGINVAGIQVDAANTATLSFPNNLTHAIGSSGLVFSTAGGGGIDMEDSNFTITGGPFHYLNADLWTTPTGSVTLAGTCVVTGDYAQELYDLTLSPGGGNTITIHSGTNLRVVVTGTCTINGEVVLDDVLAVTGDGNMVINEGAEFSGSSFLYLLGSNTGHGLTVLHSSVTTPDLIAEDMVAGTRLIAGTYAGSVRLRATGAADGLTELDNDTYNFDGGLELENTGTGLVTLQNKTNNPTINVTDLTIDLDNTGDIVIDDDGVAVSWNVSGNFAVEDEGNGGAFSWAEGLPGWKYLTDTANQAIDTNSVDIGNWDILKTTSGSVTINDATLKLRTVSMVGDGSEALVVTNSTITSDSGGRAKNFVGASANFADVDFSDAGNDINLGAATWTVTNGDFNFLNCGAFADGTSTLVMKGTGNLSFKTSIPIYNLTIFEGATTTVPAASGNASMVAHQLVVNGTLSVTADRLIPNTTCTVSLDSNGEITGGGILYFQQNTGGGGLTSFAEGAAITIDDVQVVYPTSTAVFVGATWDCGTLFKVFNSGAATKTWAPTGTHTFNCPVEFENTNAGGTLQISGANNPSYVFTDNLVWDETAGTLEWVSAGTGTITLSGGDNQAIDLDDQTIEDVIVSKSANTLTLGAGFTTDSFYGQQGIIDFNAQTIITTGRFSMSGAASVNNAVDAMNGTDLTVGGVFAPSGQDFQSNAGGWLLTCNGGSAANSCLFEKCDASGGDEVWAFNSTDGGGNTNFRFQTLTSRQTQSSIGIGI